jgi:hypothetical protein
MRPPSSSGRPELGDHRHGLDARRPAHRRGTGSLVAGEQDVVGLDAVERRRRADLDAAAAQLRRGELRQGGEISGHDPVARLDEDEAQPVAAAARVVLDDVGGEVLQLGDALEPA